MHTNRRASSRTLAAAVAGLGLLALMAWLLNTTPVQGTAGPVPAAPSAATLIIPYSLSSPAVDGLCGAGEYAEAASLTLLNAAGNVSQVYLKYDGNKLYICLKGVAGQDPARYASVYLDTDNGREQWAEADDYALWANVVTGTLASKRGTGRANGYFPAELYGWTAKTTYTTTDQVEYSIPIAFTGGQCGATFGLSVFHHRVSGAGDDYAWPAGAIFDQPQTWQSAALAGASCPQTCGGVYTTTADTTVRQSQPDTTLNDQLYLEASRATGATPDEARIYLAFDLNKTIPRDAIIHSAELELRPYTTPNPSDYVLQVYGLSGRWDDLTLTWNTQPSLTIPFAQRTFHVGVSDTLRADVSTLVNLWTTEAVTNTSLALLPGSISQTVKVARMEDLAGAHAARLIVNCDYARTPVPSDPTAANLRQQAGLARLAADSTETPTVRMSDDGGVRFATFGITAPLSAGTDSTSRAWWFMRAYSDALRLDNPDAQLQLAGLSSQRNVVAFRQVHAGLPVYPAKLQVALMGNHIYQVGGAYLPAITLDPTPHIDAERARAIVRALAGPNTEFSGDTSLNYYNAGLSGADGAATHLAWMVNLKSGQAYWIDANSGQVLWIDHRSDGSFGLDLETGNGAGESSWCGEWAFTTSDDFWCDEDGCNADADTEGINARKYMKQVYNWWYNTLGRDSYDNDGSENGLYVHVTFDKGLNAHWLPSGECIEFSDGMPVLDIVAHEFGHGVTEHRAGSDDRMAYQNESGAIDEAFADIFAHYVDGNWTIGEGSSLGILRDMSDPTQYGQPDRYNSPLRKPSTSDPKQSNDYGGVHTNSGIINHAAYLIEAGGTFNGYTINGLGKAKTVPLMYLTLATLSSNAVMKDVRHAANTVVKMWADYGTFGFTNQTYTLDDVCQVRNAFAAVELGAGDHDCDGVIDSQDPDNDGDGWPDSVDHCKNVYDLSNKDTDGDGKGDACDSDDDNDGKLDTQDNCPLVVNPNQGNHYGSSLGDACEDYDGDGFVDAVDNCPAVFNDDQLDTDQDGVGDVCDSDDDNDGKLDTQDNCPFVANPTQADGDADGLGNACDLCPAVSSSDNSDPDGDGLANPCDPDDDNDGILDAADNCPVDYNPDQFDLNGNGLGVACDPEDQATLKAMWNTANSHLLNMGGRVVIPLPDTCTMCGPRDALFSYLWGINIQMSTPFYAQVVNSDGLVSAHTRQNAGGLSNQTLKLHPAPYTVNRAGAVSAQSVTTASAPAAPRNWLEIYAPPGTPPTQTFTMTLQLTERSGLEIFLPLVLKN